MVVDSLFSSLSSFFSEEHEKRGAEREGRKRRSTAASGEGNLLSSFSSVSTKTAVVCHFPNSRRGVGSPPTQQLRTERTVRDVKAASCCKLPWQETRKDEHLCGAACGAEQLSLLSVTPLLCGLKVLRSLN